MTSVSVGYDSTCATLSTGGVDCWGYNRDGELGNNTTTQEPTRSRSSASIARAPSLRGDLGERRT